MLLLRPFCLFQTHIPLDTLFSAPPTQQARLPFVGSRAFITDASVVLAVRSSQTPLFFSSEPVANLIASCLFFCPDWLRRPPLLFFPQTFCCWYDTIFSSSDCLCPPSFRKGELLFSPSPLLFRGRFPPGCFQAQGKEFPMVRCPCSNRNQKREMIPVIQASPFPSPLFPLPPPSSSGPGLSDTSMGLNSFCPNYLFFLSCNVPNKSSPVEIYRVNRFPLSSPPPHPPFQSGRLQWLFSPSSLVWPGQCLSRFALERCFRCFVFY